MQKAELKVAVGWGSQTETSVNLNFRLEYDGFEWVELIEYVFLCELYECIEASGSIRDAYFPTIDDQLLREMTLSKSPQKKSISPNYVQNMEVIRKSMEVWAYAVLSHIKDLDDESLQWCKQLFFKSPEKLLVFERLTGESLKSKSLSAKDSSASASPVPGTPPRSKEPVRNVPKNDPTHKDYNKSIFTKMSHKIQKIGRPKNNNNSNNGIGIADNSDNNNNNPNRRRAESDDDEPRLTITDRESVFTSSQSDKQPHSQGGASHRKLSPISISGMFRKKDSQSPIATEEEEQQQPASVKVEVQRGEEYKPGVIVYDIVIKITSKKHPSPVVFSTFQRYNSFKQLADSLPLVLSSTNSSSSSSSSKNIAAGLTAPFPRVTTSEAFFGLSDTALSERTRALDVWLREVLTLYRSFPDKGKALVREFLNMDLAKPKDIYTQDQLIYGTIEPFNGTAAAAGGASSPGSSVVLVVPRSVALQGSRVGGSSVVDHKSVSAASAAIASAGAGTAAAAIALNNSSSSSASVSGAGPRGGAAARQSFYAASEAGGAYGRQSLVGGPQARETLQWETQSSATGRRN